MIKTYKIESGDVTIFKNVSLQVKAGEFVSVVAPSGIAEKPTGIAKFDTLRFFSYDMSEKCSGKGAYNV